MSLVSPEEYVWAKNFSKGEIVEVKIENRKDWEDAEVLWVKKVRKVMYERYEIKVRTISNKEEWSVLYNGGIGRKAIRKKPPQDRVKPHSFF